MWCGSGELGAGSREQGAGSLDQGARSGEQGERSQRQASDVAKMAVDFTMQQLGRSLCWRWKREFVIGSRGYEENRSHRAALQSGRREECTHSARLQRYDNYGSSRLWTAEGAHGD